MDFKLYAIGEAGMSSSENVGYIKGSPMDNPSYSPYPNPFIQGEPGHNNIIFDSLDPGTVLEVYSISGILLRKLEEEVSFGKLYWDGSDNKGRPLESGIYIYLLRDLEGRVAKGKLAIIK